MFLDHWPLWWQYYAMIAVFTFGLILGQPNTGKHRLNWFGNLFMSLLMGVFWPVSACLIGGAILGEVADRG